MDNNKLIIFLYTGYTPRAAALINRIEKAYGNQVTVTLIDSEESILEKRVGQSNSIVMLDLPNIKKPALQTIKLVKKHTKKSKLVAIHIYTSKLLIDPLYEAGVDGYLPYEPEPSQLKFAIKSILSGDKYYPTEFYA